MNARVFVSFAIARGFPLVRTARMQQLPLVPLLALLCCGIVTDAVGQVTPSIDVGAFELVRSVRIDRTRFDYTYRVTFTNEGTDFAMNLTAQVRSVVQATTVVDDAVAIGDVASGQATQPADTFTIRHDRSVAFSPAALRWTFRADMVQSATPPPDPGDAGAQTLRGTDVNQNAVRDDVERRILTWHGPGEVRDSLLWRAQLIGATIELSPQSNPQHLYTQLFRNLECLYSIDSGSASARASRVTSAMLNTIERVRAYYAYSEAAGGLVLTAARPDQQAASCLRELEVAPDPPEVAP